MIPEDTVKNCICPPAIWAFLEAKGRHLASLKPCVKIHPWQKPKSTAKPQHSAQGIYSHSFTKTAKGYIFLCFQCAWMVYHYVSDPEEGLDLGCFLGLAWADCPSP